MLSVNYLSVVAAAIASFVIGGLWYSPLLFGQSYMELRGMSPEAMASSAVPVGKMIAEFVRGLVIAFVLAQFAARFGVTDWLGAIQLGLWAGVGFYVMIYVGAVIHEDLPWKLFAIHAGDGLVKITAMSLILGLWRK